jgi:hypothetical protein
MTAKDSKPIESPTIVGINSVFTFYASYWYKHRQWMARSPILAFIGANLVPRGWEAGLSS